MADKTQASSNPKIYRGQKGYHEYVQEEPERKHARQKIMGVLGPSKSSANVRVSTRFDYQQDICKDYKETGYCGFGDSCIFLHDRSDYKTGWQLEKEWNEEQKKKEKALQEKLLRKLEKVSTRRADGESSSTFQDNDGDDDSDDSTAKVDAVPFACLQCKVKWEECKTSPCVTLCKHYFCESCFMLKCRQKCSVCGKSTQGIFNAAIEVEKRLMSDSKRIRKT